MLWKRAKEIASTNDTRKYFRLNLFGDEWEWEKIGIEEAKEVERKSCWTSYLLVHSIECVIHTDVALVLVL